MLRHQACHVGADWHILGGSRDSVSRYRVDVQAPWKEALNSEP